MTSWPMTVTSVAATDGAAVAGGESAVMPAKFSFAPEDAFPLVA